LIVTYYLIDQFNAFTTLYIALSYIWKWLVVNILL